MTLSLQTPLGGTYVTMYQGETSPSLADQLLLSNGGTLNCSGGTVFLRTRLMGGTAYTTNGTATLVSGGTAGSVQYNWGTADVAVAGEFAAWWYAETSSGTLSSAEFMVFFDQHSTPGVGQNYTSVRSTMSDLIALTRRHIGDKRGTAQQFSDAEVQQSLDLYRTYEHPRGYYGGGYGPTWRYEQLVPTPTYSPGGTIQNFQYQSIENFWEADATVTDSAYNVLSPTNVDYLAGVWVFPAGSGTPAVGQVPPVYALGKTYDIYRSCGELLLDWANQTALQFDVTMGSDTISLSQKTKRLEQMAYRYFNKAKPLVMNLERADLLPTQQTEGRRFRRYLRGDY